MSLSDTQFQVLKEQLKKKQENSSPEEYSAFLQRAATAQEKPEAETQGPFLREVGTGLAKTGAKLGLGVGQLGRSIQQGLGKLTGLDTTFGVSENDLLTRGTAREQTAQKFLSPEGVGQKIGAFAGEVAAFAVPGTQALKATKGANFLTRTASLAGADAATAGVISGDSKEAVDAAIISAAFPVVGRGAQAAKNLLPSSPDAGGRVINSLIKPLLKDFSYGKDPGKAVAEAGITASSLDELAAGISRERQKVGQSIADAVAASETRFDASDVFNSIDEAIATANKAPKTNATVINRLENLKEDLLQVNAEGVAERKVKDLTADELWQLNKDIGELTRWTGNATDDEIVNKALRDSYAATRSKLEDGVQGIDELSETYANLKSAEVATNYRDKIAERQNLISFSGGQAGIGAGLVTAAATGGVTTPLLVGAGVAAFTEATKTPRFKTELAAWLAKTSPAEKAQAFKDAPWLRPAIQAALLDDAENDAEQ